MNTKTPKLPKQSIPKQASTNNIVQSADSDNISVSSFELTNIKDTLKHYQDSTADVADVLSVLNDNKNLRPYQQKALLNILQAYCECVLVDMADDVVEQINMALDKQGGDV